MFKKMRWTKQMAKAVVYNDYEMATKVATKMQNLATKYWEKKKNIPYWLCENLTMYNRVFGWIKQEEEEWGWK